jgi:hypothetical protein
MFLAKHQNEKEALIDPGHRRTQDSHYLVPVEASTLMYIKILK